MSTRVPDPRLLALLASLALGTFGCQRPSAALPTTLATAAAQAGPSTGSTGLQTLESGGETRQYLLHVPSGLPAGELVALVVNLHGFSSNASEQERMSGMSAKADAEGFIVVYPQAVGDPPTWRVGPLEGGQSDLEFIADLVAHLSAKYPVDPRRVFATGISSGGGMADRLACARADLFAAVGPVSGAYLFSGDCHPSRPVPIAAFHGTADRIVPYEGKGRVLPPVRQRAADWASRNGCSSGPMIVFQQGEVTGEAWGDCSQGADVVLYTIEGRGHNWPGADLLPGLDVSTNDVNATDVIWQFFESHPKP